MSELEQETSTSLKDLLIGDAVAAFVTGTVLGFTIAYGILKFCPSARNFFLNVNDNPGYVNVDNKD